MKGLPSNIELIVRNKPYEIVQVGLSGAEVRKYGDCVLKIQPHTEQSANEATFMRYLRGKVLVPEVLEYTTQDGLDYLLMSRLEGEMLFADKYLSNQRLLFETASKVLFALWNLPVQECPCDMALERKLRIATSNVENNRIDFNLVNATRLGPNGRFKTPEALLNWLIDNKPSEELTVSHGDFCLPNIIDCGGSVGIIDFPYGGVADKYNDVALLSRSIRSNLGGKFGGKVYGEFDEKLFFDILGIKPGLEKMDYYILLDELF